MIAAVASPSGFFGWETPADPPARRPASDRPEPVRLGLVHLGCDPGRKNSQPSPVWLRERKMAKTRAAFKALAGRAAESCPFTKWSLGPGQNTGYAGRQPRSRPHWRGWPFRTLTAPDLGGGHP